MARLREFEYIEKTYRGVRFIKTSSGYLREVKPGEYEPIGVKLSEAKDAIDASVGGCEPKSHFDCRDGETCPRCGIVVKRDHLGREVANG